MNFNTNQLKAIQHINGPLLLIAGPGSGKTRVITNRIYNLLNNDIKEENILAITFTKKAASEMKERIDKLIGKNTNITILTFHAFCYKMINHYAKYIGYSPNITIIDENNQYNILKKLIKILNINICPEYYNQEISKYNNRYDDINEHVDEEIKKLNTTYHNFLKDNNSLDFEYIMMYFLKLLENEEIKNEIQEKYKYILVDEYQDTNNLQLSIIKILAEKYKNICVVGDENQSIYSWRFANIKNILDFNKHFDNTQKLELNINYRSTNELVNYTTFFINHNTEKFDKDLFSYNKDESIIKVQCFDNVEQEAKYILNELPNLKGTTAILYRNNFQSEMIESIFIQNKIKYNLSGSKKLYTVKYINYIIQILNYLYNPKNEIYLKDIYKIISKEELEEIIKLKNDKVVNIITYILNKTNYLNICYQKYGEESVNSNIRVLTDVSLSYDNLNDFLEDFYLQEDMNKSNKEYIQLSTCHAAKGLEYDNVFIIGVENGVFPNRNTENIEEERRILYVAMTRAKNNLYISYCKYRHNNGKLIKTGPSPFIEELEYV